MYNCQVFDYILISIFQLLKEFTKCNLVPILNPPPRPKKLGKYKYSCSVFHISSPLWIEYCW